MSIQGINTNYGGTSVADTNTSSGNATEEVGIDQFLTLFIAQIKNQDPLSPLDSAEFTAQLAQFTSVEQLYGMNSSLSDIKETLNDQGGQQDLIGLIGKTIKADENTISVENGQVLSGFFNLEESAETTVTVYDSNGLEIRRLYLGWKDEGEHNIDWDGRDESGEIVPDGAYTFEVTPRDENGYYVAASTYISGEVTGVTYQYGDPYLMIGDKLINKDNITEINKTTTEN
ncbi:MAG: flagellar hook capping FlgD N-terminal domain-containing protein [Desulfobacterales bacterium]|jgi:flagellar basal-body rod modification protein FlgD